MYTNHHQDRVLNSPPDVRKWHECGAKEKKEKIHYNVTQINKH